MSIKINGTAGIEMASDDSLTFGDVAINRDNVGGRKNAIINGNFDVWQRGTGPFTTNNTYSSDRWYIRHSTSTQSVSRASFTLGQTNVPNEPEYYLSSVVTTGSTANSYALIEQRIESVRSFAGQVATLSFYAKADAAKNIAVEFLQYFGTGGSPSGTEQAIGVTTIPLTASWQKFEVNVSIPSINGKTLGTNSDDWSAIRFWFEAGSDSNAQTNSLGNQSGTFDIAQVQLEAGSQATPFERRSYGEELALCQRYYERFDNNSEADGKVYSHVASYGSGAFYGVLYYKEKRTRPSVTFGGGNIRWYRGSSNTNLPATSFGAARIGEKSARVSYSTTTTAGQAGWLECQSAETGYIEIDAEL